MVEVLMFGITSDLFANSPDESLLCGFCLDVLNNPHQCPNGHCFCLDCLSGYLNVYQCCPICKVSTPTIQQYSMNTEVRTTIESLPSKCCIESKTVNKCTWIGPLHERQGHIYNDCLYRETCCPHDGCTAKVLKLVLQPHVDECPKRMVSCKHCNKSIRFEARKKHSKVCVIRKKNAKEKLNQLTSQINEKGEVEATRVGDKTKLYKLQFANNLFKFDGMGRGGEMVEGTLEYFDGTTYEGQFKNCVRHGYGIDKELDGEIYIGQFVNDARHGHGTYSKNGYTFDGHFENGRAKGKATVYHTSGSRFMGEMVDTLHGFDMVLTKIEEK